MKDCRDCQNYGLFLMITSNKPYGYAGDIPCHRCVDFRPLQSEFVPRTETPLKEGTGAIPNITDTGGTGK